MQLKFYYLWWFFNELVALYEDFHKGLVTH